MRRAFLPTVASVVLLAASPADGATASWGKINNFGLGMLQNAVYEQHGFGTSGSPRFYTSYRVGGGRIDLLFKHGRVSAVSCSASGPPGGGGCPAGFALPDGVALGSPVPYRSPWHGYARYTPQEPQYDFFYWRKAVRVGGRTLHVYLLVERGKIVSISETT
jgi:hypothetical protein